MEKRATLTSAIQRSIQTCARFLFQIFIEPRSADEDSRRHEFILNILLLCSIFLSFVCLLVVTADVLRNGSEYGGVPWWSVALIFGLFVGLHLASRAGFFRVSAYVMLFLYAIPLIYMTAAWGMDLPQGLLTYALLITMSSVLISTRFSLIFSSILITYLGALALAFEKGWWIPDSSWREHPYVALDGLVFVFTFAAIAAVSWLSNREIDKSLLRARRSEAALKHERDLLEVKVTERTAELRAAQAAQIAQLHRFVEFGRLASGLFHDLANPLTAVALNLESLHEMQPSDAQRARLHVEQALKATKGLENFIGAARKQLQTQELKKLFDVNLEIREVISVLSHKAKKVGVEITFKTTTSYYVFGNPLKFHQIVANLISNAIDAYSNLPRDVKRDPIIITLAKTHEVVEVKVTDRGCGIATDQQTQIFEPFFTTKGPESGMGIGLSSAKNIVEKDFHGTITFTSIPGQGTSFTLRLPLTPAPATP